MKRCTTAFPLLGEMLVTGSQYAVRSHWNAEKADEHMIQAIVGLSYKTPGYEGPAGGFVFAAPLPNGGCEGAMLRVAPFPRACKDVLPLLPPGSTAADTLSGVQTYNLGKGQGQGMLIPAGSASCIAISTTRSPSEPRSGPPPISGPAYDGWLNRATRASFVRLRKLVPLICTSVLWSPPSK